MVNYEVLRAAAMEKRKALGHTVDWPEKHSAQMGGSQVVMLDVTARLHCSASSPWKDRAALPEPDPYFVNTEKKS
jgi:hypothetical protein